MRPRSAASSAILAVALVAAIGASAHPAAASGGTVLWAARSEVGRSGWVAGLGVSPDGSSVYVTGIGERPTSSPDYVTTAYDATTGAQRWSTRYDDPLHLADSAVALKVSPDGSRVYVTGRSRSAKGNRGYDYATIAYDAATGTQLWVARYDGPADREDDPAAIDVSPNGSRVFVTGQSPGVGTRTDYATIAYDAATGTQLWAARYDDPTDGLDSGRAINVTPNGSRVIVTGETYLAPSGPGLSVTIAYSAVTGAQLWLRSYQGKAGTAPHSLALSHDGTRAYVTALGLGASLSVTTIAYDTGDGARAWVAHFDRDGRWPTFTGVSPDDSRVYVSAGYAIAAFYATSGDRIWAGPLALDSVVGMVGSADGSRLYVGGNSGTDFDIVAYDPASGVEDWTGTYDVPGVDLRSASIARSPDGTKVLVAGSGVVGGSVDFWTVAFGTT